MDFSDCLFDPTSKTLVKDLSKYDEFKEDFERMEDRKDDVCRYIILMYDIKSPMRKLHPNSSDRKRESAVEAGFSLGRGGRFSPVVESMLLGDNEKVNKAIVKYLMLFGIPELVAIEGYLSQFVAESEKLVGKTADMNTYKLHKALLADINAYEEKIFGGREPIELRTALYQTIEARRRATRPEDIAKRLKDNPKDKLEDMCPYGEEYEIKPLTFLGDEEPV